MERADVNGVPCCARPSTAGNNARVANESVRYRFFMPWIVCGFCKSQQTYSSMGSFYCASSRDLAKVVTNIGSDGVKVHGSHPTDRPGDVQVYLYLRWRYPWSENTHW